MALSSWGPSVKNDLSNSLAPPLTHTLDQENFYSLLRSQSQGHFPQVYSLTPSLHHISFSSRNVNSRREGLFPLFTIFPASRHSSINRFECLNVAGVHGSLNLAFHILRGSGEGESCWKEESWIDWLNEVNGMLSGGPGAVLMWIDEQTLESPDDRRFEGPGTLGIRGREKLLGSLNGTPSYVDKNRMRHEWRCPCGRNLGTGTRMSDMNF